MTAVVRKYNPGFASDEELVQSFCARKAELESVVQTLRECTENSNPHLLVIGPRGSGKTTLLLRAVAEVRRDEELSSRLLPVVFPEESYRVSTCGEFWLECLAHLADEAPADQDGPDLRRSWEELRTERDDRTLEHRCLAAVLGFATRVGKRLVLVVENLNMLFADMADADAGWRLRHTLQTEPRIMLLASATSRFDQIDNPDQALYEQFAVRTLRPLGTEECAGLWETVTGTPPESNAIRPLEILTGGSPRLLAIVARFGAGLSFRELMDDLLNLVDEHTEYFKSHLEAFPAQERRVYLALAELWRPATTREIADGARIDTNKCSAFLKRLVDRGVVAVSGGTSRRKRYYLTERMYNIYYLLRSRRGKDAVVEALIQFMAAFYSPRTLWDVAERLRAETSRRGFDPVLRMCALDRLLELPELDGPIVAESLKGVAAMLNLGIPVLAIDGCDRVLARIGSRATEALGMRKAFALQLKADALGALGKWDEALATCDEAVDGLRAAKSPELMSALIHKSMLLTAMGRTDESLVACHEAVRNTHLVAPAAARVIQGVALAAEALALARAGRTAEALNACENSRPCLEDGGATYLAGLTLVHGILLADVGREGEAHERLVDALERLAYETSRDVREATALGLYALGLLELRRGRAAEAKEFATMAAGLCEGLRALRPALLLAAARAQLGDPSYSGMAAVAEDLPEPSEVSGDVLELLWRLAPDVGRDAMIDLIERSGSADLLLPITTALHQELGHETHVAKEVDEVAQDVRRSLDSYRLANHS